MLHLVDNYTQNPSRHFSALEVSPTLVLSFASFAYTVYDTRGDSPGPVFTKGLRLSQVLGLNVVLKLRLLSQLSFVLKPYSQRVT